MKEFDKDCLSCLHWIDGECNVFLEKPDDCWAYTENAEDIARAEGAIIEYGKKKRKC